MAALEGGEAALATSLVPRTITLSKFIPDNPVVPARQLY
jgi:hypothetical protein